MMQELIKLRHMQIKLCVTFDIKKNYEFFNLSTVDVLRIIVPVLD